MKNTTPAVLVYFEDLLMGAEYMTDAEFGQYMRLLLRQNVVGHMSDDYLERVHIGKIYPIVEDKFERDEEGKIFNRRMEDEIERRVRYSESRSKNRGNEKHMSEHMSKHMLVHMETETEIETINNNLKENGLNKNCKDDEDADAIRDSINAVVGYLNQRVGTRFKANSKQTVTKIRARLNEGYTLDDFKRVIDTKANEWLDTDYEKYLRPETLFGNKFESYLNQKPIAKSTGNAFLDLLQGGTR